MRKWIETIVLRPDAYRDFEEWADSTINLLLNQSIAAAENNSDVAVRAKLSKLSFCRELKSAVSNSYREHQEQIGETLNGR